MSQSVGKVSQIMGPVVDVTFDTSSNDLPKIYDSLEIKKEDGSILVLEVQSHVGEDVVRTISMDSTDGLKRGADVEATGNPIQMPIGDDVYGRLFNVIGDSIDGLGELPKTGKNGLPIHREAPDFDQLSTSTEVLFTGIKVIDLIEPYAKGGKIGLFGGAGVGKTVLIIDDLIATGGTAEAAAKLVEISKGKVAAFIFVINLFDLNGSDNLIKKGYKVENLIDFPGH